MHWRRKWKPTPVFLPGESQGQRSLVGCRLWVAQSWTRLKRLSSRVRKCFLFSLFIYWFVYISVDSGTHSVRVINCYLNLFWYSHCPNLIIRSSFKLSSMSFWHVPLNIFLLFWHSMKPRFPLHLSCPSLRFSHFSKSCLLLVESVICKSGFGYQVCS